MNPATFRILSEALGLTPDLYAQALNVNARSAERWFKKVPPSEQAVNYLLMTQQTVFSLMSDLEDREWIPYYLSEQSYLEATGATLPYSIYRAAAHAAALSLARHGTSVEGRFFNKDNLDITVLERADRNKDGAGEQEKN